MTTIFFYDAIPQSPSVGLQVYTYSAEKTGLRNGQLLVCGVGRAMKLGLRPTGAAAAGLEPCPAEPL